MSGQRISDMTDSLTVFPDGSYVPFVVPVAAGGLLTTVNYRYNAGLYLAKYATLAASGGSALLGYLPAGAGAVLRTVQSKLRESVSTVDFGCDLTGATNTTTQLKAFYDYCILTGADGYILAGTYTLTRGVLVFNCNFTDTLWPNIFTAGHEAVIFQVSDTATSPVITITNGTPTGAIGKYWKGGCHGGFTIIDSSSGTVATRHGVSLQGITNCKFGYLYSENLRGSGVYLPEQLYGGTNPDQAAISGCTFEGIEAIRPYGFTLENRNYNGMDSVVIDYLRGIENVSGVVFGCGQGCHFKAISAGSCAGWTWDDGTNIDADGGPPNRSIIENVECDDSEYGIRINRMNFSNFERIRFVHRYDFGPLNVANTYWPIRCYDVASGASPSVNNIKLEAIHRIEAGGTEAELGSFFYTTSPGNIQGLEMDMLIQDGAGFGITDVEVSAKIIGLTEGSRVTIRNSGRRIYNTAHNYLAIASHTGSLAIPTANYGAAGGILGFNLEQADFGLEFDATTFGFTVPYTGRALVTVKLELTLPTAASVRIGVAYLRSAAYALVANSQHQANLAQASESYRVSEIVSVNAGDVLFAMAASTGAGAMNATPSTSAAVDDRFEVEML